MKKLTVAAFDFDKTMTYHDTLLPFLLHLFPFHGKTWRVIKLIPALIFHKLGYLENQDAKEKLLMAFLKNRSYEKLVHQAVLYSHHLPQQVRPEALHRLHWHQSKGHECILISAGLEIYLKPWAKTLGLDVSATQLKVDEGRVSGKIEGRNCYGPEKVERLLKKFGPKENFTLYAYGDSEGDKELLALADYPFYRTMPPCR